MGTIIFGIDGADPDLVDQWIDELPGFQKLRRGGCTGSFDSTEPPITVPAWMCMFSGRTPSDFNVYDFKTVDFESFEYKANSSSKFRGKTLLDSMDDVIAFRVPGTTPKYPIDGWMASGFMKGSEISFEPEELREEVEKKLDLDYVEMSGSRKEKREAALNNFEVNFAVFRHLLEEKNFQVAFSVFRAVDAHMHSVDDQSSLLEVYREADRKLEHMIEFAEENDHNILVLSDHGSAQTRRKLYLNNVLRRKGFASYAGSESSKLRRLEEKAGSFLVNIGLKSQVKKVLSIFTEVTGKDPQQTQGSILESIDRQESEAFSFISGVSRYGAIWINDSRFAEGPVRDADRKAEEVVKALESEDFIEKAWIPQDFKKNPEMPDILVKAEKGTVIGAEPYNVDFHRTRAVVHDENGLIAGIGPDIGQGTINGSYRDIAPTIQALAGRVDLESGMVMEEMLDNNYSYEKELAGIDL